MALCIPAPTLLSDSRSFSTRAQINANVSGSNTKVLTSRNIDSKAVRRGKTGEIEEAEEVQS